MKDIEKQAEEYAKSIIKVDDILSTNFKVDIDIIKELKKAVLYGIELASQWNSLDEKPEKEKFHHSTSKPCIINYDNLWIGYYDYLKEEIYLAYNIDNMIETNYYVKLSEIDGWQYLPEIK